MMREPAAAIDEQAKAHAAAHAEQSARQRALTMRERGQLIESACEAAAVIYCSRLAAGLPVAERDPWPASMWEFLKKHAARVRAESAD
jgi:hypothetical protein